MRRSTPGLNFSFLTLHHRQLQVYATGLGVAADLEQRAIPDIARGCTSPYDEVCEKARAAFTGLLCKSPTLARKFLPVMLARLDKLLVRDVKLGEEPRIKSALATPV